MKSSFENELSMVNVEIKIVTTETDPYSRYHGKTVNEPLDPSFWTNQPDAIIIVTPNAFTHTQTVQLTEGPQYVIYGNSAAAGYMWHAKIFINGTLIVEGDVDRGHPLRAEFIIGTPPTPTPPAESWLPAIVSAIAGAVLLTWGISPG